VGGLSKGTVIAMAAAVVVAAVTGVPTASGEGLSPWWHLGSGGRPTYLEPGGEGTIVATIVNVGDASTSIENASHEPTPVRIVDRLPPGLQAVEVEGVIAAGTSHESLKCEHSVVEAICAVEGEKSAAVLPVEPFNLIEVRVGVVVQSGARTCEPDASTCESNVVSVSGGGGGAESHSASVSRPVTISETPAPFGVEDYELSPEESGGLLDTRAGSHPFQTTFTIGLNQTAQAQSGSGSVAVSPIALPRDLKIGFPPGLIGNPRPLARCTNLQFLAVVNECPLASVVGVAIATANEPGHVGIVSFSVPVFNLEPAGGEPARFGFLPLDRETPVYLDTSVRTGTDYGITAELRSVTQTAGFLSAVITFWGVPGSAEHDETRDGCLLSRPTSEQYQPCAPLDETDPPPFFQLPTSCTGQLRSSVEVDSWEHPGNFATGENIVSAPAQPLPALDGCDQLPFSPEVKLTPERAQASAPSGFALDVHVPQQAGPGPAASEVGSADIRDMTIALPPGVALNPAGAEGLQACSELQFAQSCPDAAKIGTVKIATPLLANPLEGAVYLASPENFPAGPGENPFGSLVAVYVVAREPESGVLVKLAGRLALDPVTGQLTATFEDTPQLPLENIDLEFFGGVFAPLSTPARCGSYTTQASFVPWSGEPPSNVSSTFEITNGSNGTACPGASLPFDPSLTGGVTNLNAGAFSPLTVTVGREDGQQAIESMRLALPPGLSGVLAGVPLCPEAQANRGTCGAASQIGETTLSAGLGGDPLTIAGGRVYLTEGYEGAPFGLSIAVPARVGPFTLQEGRPIVIRAKLEIEPATAALTITTGAIPHIIEGFPLQIQHFNITIGRPGFIFNPTNCAKMSITGTVSGAEGAQAPVSFPFRVAKCATLKFGPKLTAVTRANGELTGHGESLHLVIASPAAQANMRSLKVDLPRRLPARLETIQKACPESTFDTNPAKCPKASVVGQASVQTPILAATMAGPAYLVSKNGSGTSHPGESRTEKEEAAFPNLVLVLQGQGVRIDLTGGLFVSAKNITSVTFRSIPDVPIRRLDLLLPEGKTSILAASSGLCTKRPLRMTTAVVGQNGARVKAGVKVGVSGCKHHKPKRHKKQHDVSRHKST
jgi:hypothetical protein